MSKKERPVLSPEASEFANRIFQCAPPCDSYGVCTQCCERTAFEAGYNFGAKLHLTRLRVLEDTAKAAKAVIDHDNDGVEDHVFKSSMDVLRIEISMLREVEQAPGGNHQGESK